MNNSESKISAESHVSTRHTMSGLLAWQTARSSSSLGIKLLQLKYKIKKFLLLTGEWKTCKGVKFLGLVKFGLDSPLLWLKNFLQTLPFEGEFACTNGNCRIDSEAVGLLIVTLFEGWCSEPEFVEEDVGEGGGWVWEFAAGVMTADSLLLGRVVVM